MEKKLKVLFDITFFYTGRKNNAGRAGIFFTAYNLFVHKKYIFDNTFKILNKGFI